MTRSQALLAGLMLAGSLAVPVARADDGCQGFKWDLSAERALFAAPPAPPLPAGTGGPVTIPVGQAVDLTLAPQGEVRLLVSPGKPMLADGSYAGTATFMVPRAGLYRIALSTPAWVDVVAGDQALASADFSGAPGCASPHKVVTYSLPAGEPLGMQFTAARTATLRLTITPAP